MDRCNSPVAQSADNSQPLNTRRHEQPRNVLFFLLAQAAASHRGARMKAFLMTCRTLWHCEISNPLSAAESPDPDVSIDLHSGGRFWQWPSCPLLN